MSDREAFRLRRWFAYLSLIICVVLAFRPIPSILDSNDTGRYVAYQEDACSSPVYGDEAGAQQWTFELLMRPTCQLGGARVFLLVVASALPIAFIAFGEWRRKGSLLLAAGLLVSVVGFELTTNALRQAVSLAFLLAAISLEGKLARLLALCIAVLLHTSSWIFLPWVLLLRRGEPKSGNSESYTLLLAVPIVCAVWYFLAPRIGTQLAAGLDLLEIYRSVYSTEVNRAFLIFMIFPTCWVFAVRWADGRLPMPRDEKLTFYYSAVVLVATIVFFPMMTYRVAMTTAVLQMFVAMKAMDLSVRSGAWIGSGLAGHFLIYAFVSPNVRAVLNV
jgi:hypothetical protein